MGSWGSTTQPLGCPGGLRSGTPTHGCPGRPRRWQAEVQCEHARAPGGHQGAAPASPFPAVPRSARYLPGRCRMGLWPVSSCTMQLSASVSGAVGTTCCGQAVVSHAGAGPAPPTLAPPPSWLLTWAASPSWGHWSSSASSSSRVSSPFAASFLCRDQHLKPRPAPHPTQRQEVLRPAPWSDLGPLPKGGRYSPGQRGGAHGACAERPWHSTAAAGCRDWHIWASPGWC